MRAARRRQRRVVMFIRECVAFIGAIDSRVHRHAASLIDGLLHGEINACTYWSTADRVALIHSQRRLSL